VACMTVIGFFSYPIAWIIMPEEPPLLPAPVGTPQATHS
jgi:phage shock protein PspC (stress-responsive transcriptional regulator)